MGIIGRILKGVLRFVRGDKEKALDDLPKYTIKAVVIVRRDERTCKVCSPKHNSEYIFPGKFSREEAQAEIEKMMKQVASGDSPEKGILPKYHPNCRCTIRLKKRKQG